MGDVLKLLREKETVVNGRIGESPSRMDKLEQIFWNLSSAFSSVRTIEKTPVIICKSTQVTKNKGATSNSNKEDLKMISIHPNFVEMVNGPICKNDFFQSYSLKYCHWNMQAKSLKDSSCLIEELET